MSSILIGVIIGIIVGVLGGILLTKYKIRKLNKEINKNAENFLNGKYENTCDIEGEKVKCDKFILREEGKEFLIAYKDGKLTREEIKESSEVESKVNKVDFSRPEKVTKKTQKKLNKKESKKSSKTKKKH